MDKRWRGVKSPDLEEIGSLAEELYQTLPKHFRDRCENLVIHITEFPDDETLRAFGNASPFDLMGLYRSDGDGGPDMVFLYRRPMLDYWTEHSETLDHVIRHVLIHEIGHHFGLSDSEMEAIEEESRVSSL